MTVARYKWLVLLIVLTGSAGAVRFMVHPTSPMLAAIVAIAAMVAAFVILRKEWAEHDEASREAHKTSWYWGATFGIVLSGFALSLLMASKGSVGDVPALGSADPLGYFAAGALALMLVQLVCYLAVWAAWWLSKR